MCCLILVPDHVYVLDSVKIRFPFANPLSIQIHFFVSGVPLLIKLIDDQCGVAVDVEVLDS